VLPERAGYYLGARMVEAAISAKGFAWSVRASADELAFAGTRHERTLRLVAS